MLLATPHCRSYYNLNHDDGVTFTGATGYNASWSLKRSYLEVIAGIREVVGTKFVMLMNSLGYSSLSFMPSYDGTFSEGMAFNAVGILGAGGMVNIMWTASAGECCSSPAGSDLYFQRRLFMGVYPVGSPPHNSFAFCAHVRARDGECYATRVSSSSFYYFSSFFPLLFLGVERVDEFRY